MWVIIVSLRWRGSLAQLAEQLTLNQQPIVLVKKQKNRATDSLKNPSVTLLGRPKSNMGASFVLWGATDPPD